MLAACQISRGALYHHCAEQGGLLEAVFEAVEIDVTTKVLARAASPSGAVEAVRAGRDAVLDLTQDPVVRQIMLTDAPSVLGWEKWRKIDDRHAFGLIRRRSILPPKRRASRPTLVDAFAHMLLASLSEDRAFNRRGGRWQSSALENGKGARPRASPPLFSLVRLRLITEVRAAVRISRRKRRLEFGL